MSPPSLPYNFRDRKDSSQNQNNSMSLKRNKDNSSLPNTVKGKKIKKSTDDDNSSNSSLIEDEPEFSVSNDMKNLNPEKSTIINTKSNIKENEIQEDPKIKELQLLIAQQQEVKNKLKKNTVNNNKSNTKVGRKRNMKKINVNAPVLVNTNMLPSIKPNKTELLVNNNNNNVMNNNNNMNKEIQYRNDIVLDTNNNMNNNVNINNVNNVNANTTNNTNANINNTIVSNNTCNEALYDEHYKININMLDQYKNNKTGLLNQLYSTILSWNLSTTELPLSVLPDTFPDAKTYIELYNVHLLEEIRSQTLQKKEKAKYYSGMYENNYINTQTDPFTYLIVTLNKSFPKDIFHNMYTCIMTSKPVYNPDSPIIQDSFMGICTVVSVTGASITLQLRINTNVFHSLSLSMRQTLYIFPLLHLSTAEREYLSLYNIKNISLSSVLLNPTIKTQSTLSMKSALPPLFLKYLHTSFNESQYKCIMKCTDNEGVVLIQGPPGTGKTQTIYGILNTLHVAIYNGYKNALVNILLGYITNKVIKQNTLSQLIAMMREQIAKPRILVVAPSNAAIDVLVDRCLSKKFIGSTSTKYIPELLRLGAGSSPQHNNVSLEFITKNRIDCPPLVRESQLNQITKVKKEREIKFSQILDYIDQQINSTSLAKFQTSRKYSTVMNDLITCIEDYENTCETYHQFTMDKEKDIQKSILNNSDIIFTTLSSSGVSILDEVDLYNREYDCVIIDEACQSTEISTLIPLRFGAKKLVLVGDPQQLPATIFSYQAVKYGYGRSLFQRFMNNNYPVYMLNIQYRCHPFISYFPSYYFYSSKLLNSKHVQQKDYHKEYHDNPLYRPVLFYNIARSKETSNKLSYFNTMEAQFILNLYKSFLTLYTDQVNSKILILTPYNEQKKLLVQLFSDDPMIRHTETQNTSSSVTTETNTNNTENTVSKKEIDSSLSLQIPSQTTDSINNHDSKTTTTSVTNTLLPMPVISTIDAAQGQESDIVILSCVRAGSQKGVGFVNDIHRLNVALTRPKFALWVIGNTKKLAQSKIWKDYLNFCYNFTLIRRIDNVNIDINKDLYNSCQPIRPIPDIFQPSLDNIPLDSDGNINIKECLIEEKPGVNEFNEEFVYSDGELNSDLVYKPIFYSGCLNPIQSVTK